jgi:hypothetical protein
MYPHERSLVKRLAGKPFALLGVNSDSDREELKKILEQEQITWRSWWDAGSVNGPIQTKWQVAQRPAIYVLDAQGVIRHKDLMGDDLDKAVDALVASIGSQASPKAPGSAPAQDRD